MTAHANDLKNTTNNLVEMKLNAFNDVSSAWKQLFDNPPDISLLFTVNDRNELMLDNIVIDDISRVAAEGAKFVSDHIYLPCADRPGCYYRIKIVWTFDDKVYVDEVSLVVYTHSSDN